MSWWRKIFKSDPNNIKGPPTPLPPISLEITQYEAEHYWGKHILCEAYLLTGSFTLNEIAQFVRDNRKKHPDSKLFATLDHPAQAAYTSGHSCDIHELDSLNGHNEKALPDSAFGKYEEERFFIGHFPIRHINFMKNVAKYSPKSMENQLSWVELNNYFATVRTPATVNELKRDEESLVQIVPVVHSAEALAAFPNGYFDADLNPFEVYVLARELYDRFKLSFFGVGATYLGFMADEPIEDTKAAEIAKYLSKCIDHKNNIYDILFEQIKGQSEIYISYGLRE